MHALILAAGYATRLYPLTLTQPKPLLRVAGRPIIDHLLERLAPASPLQRVYVVTNAKFAGAFEHWARAYHAARPGFELRIVNDGSTDDSNKLGALGDLHLVLEREGVDDDLIVVAGDNLFSESLAGFGEACRAHQAPVLGIYDVKDVALARKYSTVTVAPDGRLLSFVEKPPQPASTLAGIALYHYPRQILPLIRQYITEGNNPDQPGRLVQWMCQRVPFYTWQVSGDWFDIGSKESLEEADRIFSAR
jgi:glucose-1-phosphate thymidylyltransferase